MKLPEYTGEGELDPEGHGVPEIGYPACAILFSPQKRLITQQRDYSSQHPLCFAQASVFHRACL